MQRLTLDQARELAVAVQCLADPPAPNPGKADVLKLVRRLGCVQIDTISVVARSHYLVIWSRLGDYEPDWLDELLHPDRQVFEYWAHAASLIPIELYPYFRRRMKAFVEAESTRSQSWRRENADVVEEVRRAVREHGPLSSSHFERPPGDQAVPAWAWWGGKPTNRALDILWSSGELIVHRRERFQRFYDLSHRHLPFTSDVELPAEVEEQRVLALRAVRAIGPTIPRWLNDYFRTRWGSRAAPRPTPAEILADLASDGELISIEIEGLGPGYVARENERYLERALNGQRATHLTLLSPFDNLIWDRRRTLDLFRFDYRLESYTPAAKRRYGYYTLPILRDGRLIGRLEPKLDRRRRLLLLRSLHLEPGTPSDAEFWERFVIMLREFATFNRADEIALAPEAPGLAPVARALKSVT